MSLSLLSSVISVTVRRYFNLPISRFEMLGQSPEHYLFLGRQALENHETYRTCFGGKVFTAAAIRDNLKAPDGQQWIACVLS